MAIRIRRREFIVAFGGAATAWPLVARAQQPHGRARRGRSSRLSDSSIVFATDGDPVQLGLVASLNRPGGNVTGATQLNVEEVKRSAILRCGNLVK